MVLIRRRSALSLSCLFASLSSSFGKRAFFLAFPICDPPSGCGSSFGRSRGSAAQRSARPSRRGFLHLNIWARDQFARVSNETLECGTRTLGMPASSPRARKGRAAECGIEADSSETARTAHRGARRGTRTGPAWKNRAVEKSRRRNRGCLALSSSRWFNPYSRPSSIG